MHTIRHTFKGYSANCIARRRLPSGAHSVFIYAVNAYGYLVPHNETYTSSQWVEAIQRSYAVTRASAGSSQPFAQQWKSPNSPKSAFPEEVMDA
jgi:ribosomal protein L32E